MVSLRNPIFHSTKSITTIFTKQRRTDEKVHGTCQITRKNLTKISPFFAYTYTEKNFHLAEETCAFGIHNIFIAYTPTDTSIRTLEFSFAFSSFFALFYYTIHLDWDLNTLSNYVFMILCVNTNCATHTLSLVFLSHCTYMQKIWTLLVDRHEPSCFTNDIENN